MAEKGSNRSASNSSTDSGSPQSHRYVIVPNLLGGNLPEKWSMENTVARRYSAPVGLLQSSVRGNVNSREKRGIKRRIRGSNLECPGRPQTLQLMPEAPRGNGGSEILPPPCFYPPPPLFAAMGMGLNPSLEETAGSDFTMHMVTVNRGEDVVAKILSFTKNGTRGVCTVSATGDVSNITLRKPLSGYRYTHLGIFHLLTLNGSFISPRNGGIINCYRGDISVSVSCNEGRVIGGTVSGPLWAASPVQLVVGSFKEPANRGRTQAAGCTRKRKQRDVPDQENAGVVPAAAQTAAGAGGNTGVVTAATHTAAGTVGERSEPGRNEEQDQNAASPNGQHEKETRSTPQRMLCPDINETAHGDEGPEA